MTYSTKDLAEDLERAAKNGYDISKVSNAAFRIFQEHSLEISDDLDRKLLALIAMVEGPEFELTEAEFLTVVHDLRAESSG